MYLVGFGVFWLVATQKSCYFYTDPWGRWIQFDGRIFFSNGLVHPPGSCVVFCLFVWLIGFVWLVGWSVLQRLFFLNIDLSLI